MLRPPPSLPVSPLSFMPLQAKPSWDAWLQPPPAPFPSSCSRGEPAELQEGRGQGHPEPGSRLTSLPQPSRQCPPKSCPQSYIPKATELLSGRQREASEAAFAQAGAATQLCWPWRPCGRATNSPRTVDPLPGPRHPPQPGTELLSVTQSHPSSGYGYWALSTPGWGVSAM